MKFYVHNQERRADMARAALAQIAVDNALPDPEASGSDSCTTFALEGLEPVRTFKKQSLHVCGQQFVVWVETTKQ